jgi:hypothetical protein
VARHHRVSRRAQRRRPRLASGESSGRGLDPSPGPRGQEDPDPFVRLDSASSDEARSLITAAAGR